MQHCHGYRRRVSASSMASVEVLFIAALYVTMSVCLSLVGLQQVSTLVKMYKTPCIDNVLNWALRMECTDAY